MQPSDVIIETRNLTKVYRDFWGRQKVRALKALDLGNSPRRDLRSSGAQWVRQDDHHEADPGPPLSHQRSGLVFGRDATEVTRERADRIPARRSRISTAS